MTTVTPTCFLEARNNKATRRWRCCLCTPRPKHHQRSSTARDGWNQVTKPNLTFSDNTQGNAVSFTGTRDRIRVLASAYVVADNVILRSNQKHCQCFYCFFSSVRAKFIQKHLQKCKYCFISLFFALFNTLTPLSHLPHCHFLSCAWLAYLIR